VSCAVELLRLENLMVTVLMPEPVSHRVVVVLVLLTVTLLFRNLHFYLLQYLVEMLSIFLKLSRATS
jgi:hypothetical protein